jgi:predicted ATPase
MPNDVNYQITDAITQSNVKVLAEAPAMAMGTIYQALAHSTGMMFENSVNTQQQQNMLQQAATAQGVIQMYSVDTLSDADAATALSESLVQILKSRQ